MSTMQSRLLETEDEMPAGLPRPCQDGLPIPWTAQYEWGSGADFAAMDPSRAQMCRESDLCGVCGEELDELRVAISNPKGTIIDTLALHPGCASITAKWCTGLTGEDAIAHFQYTFTREEWKIVLERTRTAKRASQVLEGFEPDAQFLPEHTSTSGQARARGHELNQAQRRARIERERPAPGCPYAGRR